MGFKTVSLVELLVGLLAAPLLPGIINRIKAYVAGRRGPPVLQLYHDLHKLLSKGAVYSRTTTWVFRAGPVVGLAAMLAVLPLAPWGGQPALISFPGDWVLLAGLLGLARFWTVLAALDTGSSFEGMGASREMTYSALVEPVLFLGFAVLVRITGALSLNGIFKTLEVLPYAAFAAPLLLVMAGFFILLLTENARLPVDDPNTHLELTMIHEVMILDHSGVDLAIIQYSAALKLWLLSVLTLSVGLSTGTGQPALDLAIFSAGMVCLAVLIGLVEAAMARLRLLHVPRLLAAAGIFILLALLLVKR